MRFIIYCWITKYPKTLQLRTTSAYYPVASVETDKGKQVQLSWEALAQGVRQAVTVVSGLSWEAVPFQAHGCWQVLFLCLMSLSTGCPSVHMIGQHVIRGHGSQRERERQSFCNIITDLIPIVFANFYMLETSHQVQPTYKGREI